MPQTVVLHRQDSSEATPFAPERIRDHARTRVYSGVILGYWLAMGTAWPQGLAVGPAEGLLVDPEGRVPHFLELDSNEDGFIAPAEAEGWDFLSRNFGEIDSDGDGAIDAVEYRNALAPDR